MAEALDYCRTLSDDASYNKTRQYTVLLMCCKARHRKTNRLVLLSSSPGSACQFRIQRRSPRFRHCGDGGARDCRRSQTCTHDWHAKFTKGLRRTSSYHLFLFNRWRHCYRRSPYLTAKNQTRRYRAVVPPLAQFELLE